MSLISKMIAEQIRSGDKESAREAIREALNALAYEHVVREEFAQIGENYDELSDDMASLNEEVLKEECECEDPENCDCEQMDAEQGDEEVPYEDENDELQEQTEVLTEKKIVKRVNSKGKIIRKVKCSAGMKAKDGKCVRMDSKEKITRKKALIKRGRTMKRQSGSKKRKALMKRQRALRKRHSMGL